ncbi:MAG: ribosome-associated translation inhibitor RaiA [Candidatus Yonathbacteria bacterium]|nr:ribosome-associated translation inhibitor RaiA [Candidatus Yonathbacteria bacterium]
MAIHINTIKATGIDLTPAIDSYVRERVTSLEKYVDKSDTSASISVEVGKVTEHHHAGEIFRAEMNLIIGGIQFRATADHEDLYAAIDKVREEASRMISEHKKKQKQLFKKGAAEVKRWLTGESQK